MEPVERGQGFAVLGRLRPHARCPTNVLGAASHRRWGRVLAVFGAGGDRTAKRPLMGEAVARRRRGRAHLDNRNEAPDVIADAVHRGLRSGPAQVTVELDRRRDSQRASAACFRDVVGDRGQGTRPGRRSAIARFRSTTAVAGEELEALGWT
jgi:UDP-N-acetylmuramyl tripeptide synthase